MFVSKQIRANDGGVYSVRQLNEKYLEKTASLLNSEWPRSLGQRSLSLRPFLVEDTHKNSGRLKLPISLILVEEGSDRIVGQASLVCIAILSSSSSSSGGGITCDDNKNRIFLQSLIVDKSLRGKGLGKALMNASHDYLIDYYKSISKSMNEQDITARAADDQQINSNNTCFDYLYLTTKDKQTFYESLGFSRTQPLEFYQLKSSQSRCNEIIQNLFSATKNGHNQSGAAALANKQNQNKDVNGNNWFRKPLISGSQITN